MIIALLCVALGISTLTPMDETASPEPTEDPNGGTVVIGGTSTPVATSATTTDAPKGTATPTSLPDESQKLSADFKFEKQDSSSTVLLEKYIGTSSELNVRASYRLNGKTYKTVLPECTERIFMSNRTLEKNTFEDGVRTTGNSLIRMFDGCSSLTTLPRNTVDSGLTSAVCILAVHLLRI